MLFQSMRIMLLESMRQMDMIPYNVNISVIETFEWVTSKRTTFISLRSHSQMLKWYKCITKWHIYTSTRFI